MLHPRRVSTSSSQKSVSPLTLLLTNFDQFLAYLGASGLLARPQIHKPKVATPSACYRGLKPQKCPKWLGEGAKGVLDSRSKDIFETPYGAPRPTESQNPPATKKEIPQTPKTPIIPKSKRSFPKSKRQVFLGNF